MPPAPKLDLAQALVPPEEMAKIAFQYSELAGTTLSGIKGALDKLKGGLGEIEKKNLALEAGVGKPGDTTPLGKALASVQTQSATLGEALKKANVPQGMEAPPTGLEPIARAYEAWLAGGAMDTLLGQITSYFRSTPTAGPEAARTVPGRIVVDAQSAGPQRPTVEIDEVVIELEPPPEAPAPKQAPGAQGSRLPITLEQFTELMEQFTQDRSERWCGAHP
jgi:hypothetical protein